MMRFRQKLRILGEREQVFQVKTGDRLPVEMEFLRMPGPAEMVNADDIKIVQNKVMVIERRPDGFVPDTLHVWSEADKGPVGPLQEGDFLVKTGDWIQRFAQAPFETMWERLIEP